MKVWCHQNFSALDLAQFDEEESFNDRQVVSPSHHQGEQGCSEWLQPFVQHLSKLFGFHHHKEGLTQMFLDHRSENKTYAILRTCSRFRVEKIHHESPNIIKCVISYVLHQCSPTLFRPRTGLNRTIFSWAGPKLGFLNFWVFENLFSK